MSPSRSRRLITRLLCLWPPVLLFGICLGGLVLYRAIAELQIPSMGMRDTPPSIRSVGPTMVQLERLQYLVSTRVHVADVLVGESRWLEGSWLIQGDALLAVDMSKSEVNDKDEKSRTATIVLPQPSVLSPRVNHERTQRWDIKSRSWIPLASLLLGDRTAMEKQAMVRGSSSSSSVRHRRNTTRKSHVVASTVCSPSCTAASAGTSRSSGSSEPFAIRVSVCQPVPERSQHHSNIQDLSTGRQSNQGCRLSSFRGARREPICNHLDHPASKGIESIPARIRSSTLRVFTSTNTPPPRRYQWKRSAR